MNACTSGTRSSSFSGEYAKGTTTEPSGALSAGGVAGRTAAAVIVAREDKGGADGQKGGDRDEYLAGLHRARKRPIGMGATEARDPAEEGSRMPGRSRGYDCDDPLAGRCEEVVAGWATH